MPASMPPTVKAATRVRRTPMPISSATASSSWMARIARPKRVCIKSSTMTVVTAAAANTTVEPRCGGTGKPIEPPSTGTLTITPLTNSAKAKVARTR